MRDIEMEVGVHCYVVACQSMSLQLRLATTWHHIFAPWGWCGHVVVAAAPMYRCCYYDMTPIPLITGHSFHIKKHVNFEKNGLAATT
jgi:hypothetical protein